MIDQVTLQTYARQSKMDSFTILREYLQILLLNAIYQLSANTTLVFKGGTAIRLFYGSPRFSEDLDFNTALAKNELHQLLTQAVGEVSRTVPNLFIKELKSISGFSAKVYLQTPIATMPLTIKLDFSEREITHQVRQSTIATSLPIASYSLIHVMSEEEILAEKLRTIFQRQKGRDIYDIWFLLNKRVPINEQLVVEKFHLIATYYDRRQLLERIAAFPLHQLEKDLRMFLPLDQRQFIPKLPELIADRLA